MTTRLCNFVLFNTFLLSTQKFKDDVHEHESLFYNYRETNDPIYITCKELQINKGLPDIQEEVRVTEKRWQQLNQEVEQREWDIGNVLERVEECKKRLQPLQEVVTHVKHMLTHPRPFGDDLEEGRKEIDKVQVRLFVLS